MLSLFGCSVVLAVQLDFSLTQVTLSTVSTLLLVSSRPLEPIAYLCWSLSHPSRLLVHFSSSSTYNKLIHLQQTQHSLVYSIPLDSVISPIQLFPTSSSAFAFPSTAPD